MSASSKTGPSKRKNSQTEPMRREAAGPKPSRMKVQDYRARLRAQGMRPIQIWVPDIRAPSFQAEARRQSAAVAASTGDDEDQAFIDAVSDRSEE